MKTKELREKRAKLVNDARVLLDKAIAEGRELTADEETTYSNYEKDISRLGKDIERIEFLDGVPNHEPEEAGEPANQGEDEEDTERRSNLPLNQDRQRNPAILQYPAHIRNAYTERYHSNYFGWCRTGGAQFRNALEVGTPSEGGYLVPQTWEDSLIKALAEINVIRRLSRVMRTTAPHNFPLRTSRGSFTWIDEEGTFSTNDPAYGTLQAGAYKVGGIILVSEELLQDNTYNLPGELQQDAAEEFAFAEEGKMCTGNGTTELQGLFTVTTVAGTALVGKTAASPTTVTADELIDTFYTLGRRYRARASWLTGDPMAKIIRKLKDTTNQYMWQPGLVSGEPDRLLGAPFYTTDSAPAVATTNRTIMFGDFGYYRVCDRRGVTTQRLSELYAATGQVGFKFWKRLDAKLTLAPSFTYLVQA